MTLPSSYAYALIVNSSLGRQLLVLTCPGWNLQIFFRASYLSHLFKVSFGKSGTEYQANFCVCFFHSVSLSVGTGSLVALNSKFYFHQAHEKRSSGLGSQYFNCSFLIDLIGSQLHRIYKLTNGWRTEATKNNGSISMNFSFLLCSSFFLNIAVLKVLKCQTTITKQQPNKA